MRILLIAFGLLWSPGSLLAQEGISRKQQEKRLAQKEKEDKKARVQAEKDGRKRHLSIQDKATRKRIKRHTQRADKRGSGSHRERSLWFFRRKR